MTSELLSSGIFQLEMVKIVLYSHFYKEVRATIGLVPISQLHDGVIKKMSERFGNEMA